MTFQSWLGTTPWLKPLTDIVLSDLCKKGIKRLAIIAPGFVADCLETIKALGTRALGGVDVLARLVRPPNA